MGRIESFQRSAKGLADESLIREGLINGDGLRSSAIATDNRNNDEEQERTGAAGNPPLEQQARSV